MAQLLPQIQREQEEFRSQTEAVRAVQLTLDEAQTVFDDLNYTGDYDNIPTVDSAQ